MAVVMSTGVVIALIALLLTGAHRSAAADIVTAEAVAEPA
jgi:DHA1 family bicyclomycin/chloramphenicol resistance-like MFS transporter